MTNYDETRPEEMGALAGSPKKMETIDCFNAALNKPKLLIIGHGRHGKDTFADLVVAKMGLSFISSSEFVGRVAIWEQWGKERYAAFSDMFEDRVNNRTLWFNFIVAYNTPNLARTGEEMMADHDIYVGMRNPDEFHACMKEELFDHVIWVDASSRLPLEGKDSMGLTKDMADIWIDNNGPESNLTEAVDNLQKRLHAEGFEVNYIEDVHDFVDPDLATDTEYFDHVVGDHPEPTYVDENRDEPMMDRITRIEAKKASGDPCDPPIQKPLINPASTDTPKALRVGYIPDLDPRFTEVEDNSLQVGKDYVGIINPPMVPNQGTIPTPAVGTKAVVERSLLAPSIYRGGAAPAKPSEWTPIAAPGWETKPEGTIKVLDHGFFGVLEVMGSDDTICESARMSYGRGTKKTSDNKALINYLVRNYHTSPLEMGEIRFHIRMPIFVMRQWVRHRTANLNEYSGRYSEMIRLFYVPKLDQICLQDKVNKQGSAEPMVPQNAEHVQDAISEICDRSFDVYEDLLVQGVSRETARMVLPLNTYTEVVWKLDISNLIKFLRLRDDDHAQWEIQQYAKMVALAVKEYFPLVYAAYLEQRQSQTLTMDEVRTLITGDLSFVSNSQAKRVSLLRNDILS